MHISYYYICRGGRTCLHHAAYNGHLEMVEYLMQFDCVINASDKKDRRALHFAAYQGHNEIVKALIDKGADVDVKVRMKLLIEHSCKGREMVYIIYWYTLCHTYVVYLYVKDRDLYTPLHAAAASGNVECVHILINAGADIEAKNVYGNTPLHIACLNGCPLVIKALMANHVNLGESSIYIYVYDGIFNDTKSF